MTPYSPQEQQLAYPYNQSYYHNNSLLPSPNSSSTNLNEMVQTNVNSPVSASTTTTTTLHMPTPPGESNDSLCKLEDASPSEGNTGLIPLTKVRDYNNVKEIHQQRHQSLSLQNGTQLVGSNMVSLQQISPTSFNSRQPQVLQMNGVVDNKSNNCINLAFNLPLTPPPNLIPKKCQCQFDCKCE